MHTLLRKLFSRNRKTVQNAVYIPSLALPLAPNRGADGPSSPRDTQFPSGAQSPRSPRSQAFRCAVLGSQGVQDGMLQSLGEHDLERSSSFGRLFSAELIVRGTETRRTEVEFWDLMCDEELARVRHVMLPTMDVIFVVLDSSSEASIASANESALEIAHTVSHPMPMYVVDVADDNVNAEAIDAVVAQMGEAEALHWDESNLFGSRQAFVDYLVRAIAVRSQREDGNDAMSLETRTVVSPRGGVKMGVSGSRATITHMEVSQERTRKRKRTRGDENDRDAVDVVKRAKSDESTMSMRPVRPFAERQSEVCGIVDAAVGSVTCSGSLVTPSRINLAKSIPKSQQDHVKLVLNDRCATVTDVIRQRAATQSEALSPRSPRSARSPRSPRMRANTADGCEVARDRMRETLSRKYGRIINQGMF